MFFKEMDLQDGAKTILLLDVLKNVIETLFFSSFIGYFDAFIVLHLSWSILGYLGCLVGFWREKYYYFWPYLMLKVGSVIENTL
jgi:hypothetical protein